MYFLATLNLRIFLVPDKQLAITIFNHLRKKRNLCEKRILIIIILLYVEANAKKQSFKDLYRSCGANDCASLIRRVVCIFTKTLARIVT